MEAIYLVEPSTLYKEAYIDMVQEWSSTGERMIPFVLRYDYSDFDKLLTEMNRLRTSKDLAEGKVNSSTFWLFDQNKDRIIGATNIRHTLNASLLESGGHIGYGIRPSERRRGYATTLLKLALKKALDIGIDKALVTCDYDNIGSARTIKNNGGKFESEVKIDGIIIQRYWIRARSFE
ncbi:GNAT family N-acetyltransferase [Paenibacillus puldeungensis]|uniref:GNAT family N-acetyltransferase n=1 Tax=Paenibacillus puldeungensis TaxID=696536 RepID=A0ABW3S046_9BACL